MGTSSCLNAMLKRPKCTQLLRSVPLRASACTRARARIDAAVPDKDDVRGNIRNTLLVLIMLIMLIIIMIIIIIIVIRVAGGDADGAGGARPGQPPRPGLRLALHAVLFRVHVTCAYT